MSKNLLLFLLLILNTTFIFSQSDEKEHVVDILDVNEIQPINTSFRITEVIDNRIYKNNIGFAQKGMFNKNVTAVLTDSLHSVLMSYFEKLFSESESNEELTLRINQFLISEHTTAFSETGTVILNMDFLKKIDEKKYYLLDSYVNSISHNAAIDATSKHDDRIREILHEAFIGFNTKKDSISNPTVISILSEVPSSKILAEAPKAGFFTSFSELNSNEAVAFSEFKVIKEKDDKVYFENDLKESPQFYAFSDGSSIYINSSVYSSDKHYIKTKRVKDYLLFNDTFINSDNTAALATTFGLTGMLIANKNNNVLLDLKSGQYYILNNNKMKKLLKGLNPSLYTYYKMNDRDVESIKKILDHIFENKSEEMEDLIEIIKS
ncbi:hypothetical protein [Galbibacter mesophilus]|uniref:hypothetical protein n=1 Tax=Galbibacter mesophilus TaxID=379069 RepID=UPI00191F6493|nr:hypothetical protein [Galbibacter mesophilus]MCM5663616.1 hypothetical protein [Galbibacter mesophilus]